jgi:hypothetical protein
VNVQLRFVTRFYRRPSDDPGGFGYVHSPGRPPNRRMGIALTVEGDRWCVSMSGLLGEQAPSDAEGFEEYAASLPKPGIWELLRRCERLEGAAKTGFPAHVRRRFERLRRPADGIVVLGDALCSFSPVYGQWMTVAAKEAWALGDCLDAGGLEDLPRRFYKAAVPILDVAWLIATGNDLRYPEVEGPRPLRLRSFQAYLAQVRRVGRHDEEVAIAFRRVLQLVDPMRALMSPWIVARVGAGRVRERSMSRPAMPSAPPEPQTRGEA